MTMLLQAQLIKCFRNCFERDFVCCFKLNGIMILVLSLSGWLGCKLSLNLSFPAVVPF